MPCCWIGHVFSGSVLLKKQMHSSNQLHLSHYFIFFSCNSTVNIPLSFCYMFFSVQLGSSLAVTVRHQQHTCALWFFSLPYWHTHTHLCTLVEGAAVVIYMQCTINSFLCVFAGIEYVKSPVLLFHGEQDAIVPPSTVLKLVQRWALETECGTNGILHMCGPRSRHAKLHNDVPDESICSLRACEILELWVSGRCAFISFGLPRVRVGQKLWICTMHWCVGNQDMKEAYQFSILIWIHFNTGVYLDAA